MTGKNKHTGKLKQSNNEKSRIDEEIETELRKYLEDRKQGEVEGTPEKKKYKTFMFIASLMIAAIYIYKYIGHLF